MSGEKRTFVSVEESELQRLREQEGRLRSVMRDLPERLEAVRMQASREMENRLRPIRERQAHQERMIDSLGSALRGLERETMRRFKRQYEDFTAMLRDQRGEYLQMFRDQERRFTSMIDNERRARQKAVANLQTQIDAIVADAARKQDLAAKFMSDMDIIMAETEKMPHERFAPGEFDKVRRHVMDASASLNAGMPEACLSTAQRAYWDVSDLRVKIAVAEQEFILVYQAALEEARALMEQARANRLCRMEREQGAENGVEIEIDFWSRGKLSELEKEALALESRLKAGKNTLTTDQVKEILRDLERLRNQIPEIVEQARQAVLASQLRYDIAELAAEAFEKQGFTVQDETYESEDMRNAYVIKLQNIAGDEVVTVISPVPDDPGANQVSVHSFEAGLIDEQARFQRAKEMTEFLGAQGLKVDAPAHVGEANPEFRDINAVRLRKKNVTRKAWGR